MNIRIKLCRRCPRKDACAYRDRIRKEARGVLVGATVSLNCKEYRNVWKEGDRVSFKIYDRDRDTQFRIEGGEIIEGEGPWTWIEREDSPAIGTVTGKVNGFLFEINLDHPFGQLRGDIPGYDEVRETYWKQANGMKIYPPAEGSPCPRCDKPLEREPSKGCTCFAMPPCSDCTDRVLACGECGWAEERP